jgi:selenocysteine-specific elongation factor
MIIGTAGHIDHGKTSLVKALTGVDTDRLKEEKARGISIELGYAYLPTADGGVLGFVDVPGHEKFVDHMVAGATGMDFVLLVVAADDGPMPQTAEHLDIVQLIGVQRGAVVMTKIDRCDAERRSECEREIRQLLQPTFLADAPILQVSSVTGDGLAALKTHLTGEGAAFGDARRRGRGFRLAVDRCFTLGGVGTVVTGTVFAGEVRTNDPVVITPSGLAARVRSIHAQNQAAQVGRAGERCALALVGPEKDAIARGDWIVSPNLHVPTGRFDARVSLSRRESKPLKHWTPVHLHVGAAHVMARVALLDTDQAAPGTDCLAQIVTDKPIGALAGDAFILRDGAAMRTIGGGRVLDPFGPARRRRSPQRIAALRLMSEPDPGRRILALLDHSRQGIDLGTFCLSANIAADDLSIAGPAVRVREGTVDYAFGKECWADCARRLLEGLAEFHVKRPDEMGPDAGRMRRMWFPQLDAAAVEAMARALQIEQRLSRAGPCWHLPGHNLALGEREAKLAEGILPLLEAGGFDPPWVRDLSSRLKVNEQDVRILLNRLARRGEVHQVVKDLFYSKSAVARLSGIARTLNDQAGMVRAAEFRDRIGLGRKRAIQILEFFDRIGYTRRTNDEHRVRADSPLKLDQEEGSPPGKEKVTS